MSDPNRLTRLECQGARCGHIDGKKRCGVYVMGEESMQEDRYGDMARYQGLTLPEEIRAWTQGYEAGYRVGADGEQLDDCIMNEELP